MKHEDRKAAINAYKDRDPAQGIFAIRCPSEGVIWVGSTKDLDKIKNRIWFTLRMGTTPQKDLQRAWNSQGEDGFEFEELERFDADLIDLAQRRMRKERRDYWLEKFAARPF
ncbi:hypothetical protein TG4357_00604 [Thalassovita gelatinovora]|uniref:GIY-YIG domain-containing protein n=1 Tax=Thalassovita gelatinovora TaxID=53501 RepID=A0A0P1F611_THAGE|nr:GIY-YIG nuclease family protein [Thalassovita gelatinovora]CUH63323.1 hypothetical protein TG4357_00604 [Thalassovita gelatinovora]SEQ65188.1 hypothetical protein SAMN04488043_107107 [Thalassovita gelatinovora]